MSETSLQEELDHKQMSPQPDWREKTLRRNKTHPRQKAESRRSPAAAAAAA